MSVARINPSSVYHQNELARIQQNLADAIDGQPSTNTQLVDAGYYWSGSYPGGIVSSTRTIYNSANGPTNIIQSFQFPVQTTILGVSMLHNSPINVRSDFYILTNGKPLLTAQGAIPPNKTYGSIDGTIPIPANTQFNVAYSFPSTGLSVACYSYLLIQIGS